MQIIIQEQIYQNDPGLVWVEKAIQKINWETNEGISSSKITLFLC